jgi:hypothetical protein
MQTLPWKETREMTRPLLRPLSYRPGRSCLAVVAAVLLAGCGSGETISNVAKSAAHHGRPCEAAEVEPTNAKFAAECTAQQDQQAAAARAKEEIKEGERLKSEAEKR